MAFLTTKTPRHEEEGINISWCLGVLVVLLFFCSPCFATMTPAERMANPALEARAQALYKELRCVACESQSIAGSNAEMAAAMRALVREQLKNGASDAEIFSYLQDRYGDKILMRPPMKPATWFLWLTPFFALVAGGVIALKTMRGAA